MTEELKPCPFCGSEKVRYFDRGNMDGEVVCLDCQCRTGAGGDDVVTAWNRRHMQDRERGEKPGKPDDGECGT